MLEHIERSSFSRLGDPGSSHPRRPGIWRMRVLAQKMATDNNSAKGITYHGKRLERQWKENTVKIDRWRSELVQFSLCGNPGARWLYKRKWRLSVGKMIVLVMRRDDLEWLGHPVMNCLWLMRSSQPKQKFGTRIGFSASEFTEFCPWVDGYAGCASEFYRFGL